MLSAKIFLYRVKGFLRDDVLFPARVFLRSDAFRSDFHQYFRNKFMPAKISLYFLCAAVIPALGYSGSVSASCFLNVPLYTAHITFGIKPYLICSATTFKFLSLRQGRFAAWRLPKNRSDTSSCRNLTLNGMSPVQYRTHSQVI